VSEEHDFLPPRGQSWSKGFSLAFVTVAYIVAIAAGWLFIDITEWENPLWIAAGADVVGTIVIFMFSTAMRNTSMYDAYWSVAPVPIALYWMFAAEPGANSARQWIVFTLVLAWGIRLTYNWARGWPGMRHEDWRYTDFRKKTGKLYFLIDFFGLHFFPTVQVFLAMLPVWVAVSLSSGPLNILDVIAFIVTAAAIIIEGVADEQLRSFVRTKKPGEIMQQGLWKYSRHPNYFGQILLWWGFFLFALAVDFEYWWTGIGAVAITVMFLVVSVPMLDERSMERRPGYEEHCKKVSSIIPLPRRG
jgi:steroid 5-alpha reductase family enzyme